jgi:hypothetical protein
MVRIYVQEEWPMADLFGYVGAPLVRERLIAAGEVFAEMRSGKLMLDAESVIARRRARCE